MGIGNNGCFVLCCFFSVYFLVSKSTAEECSLRRLEVTLRQPSSALGLWLLCGEDALWCKNCLNGVKKLFERLSPHGDT